jgi:Spy/CpxP family protein refolding chaperone
MNMKTTLLVLTLATSNFVIAGSERMAPRAEAGDRVVEVLNLTETQQEQFNTVMQGKHDKVKAAMELIDEEILNELSNFLTDDQMQKVKQHQQRRHELRQHASEHKSMRKHPPKH